MKRTIALCVALCLAAASTRAQLALSFKDAPVDIGINAGPSFFLGDLGGNLYSGKGFLADLNFPTVRYFAGLTGTVYPSPWLGIRAAFNVGELYGNDAYSSSSDDGRKIRNLDFRTMIYEGYLGIEIDPLDAIYLASVDEQPRIHPYVVIGGGFFHFNPQGTYTNPATGQTSWIDLRPLHTEGEGFGPGFPKEYNLWQPNIPVAVGGRMDLSDRISINGEVLYRFIFTGYVDDVHGQYINPALFFQHLPASEAVIAEAMANKSVEPYTYFSTRGDPNRTNAYFSIVAGIVIHLGVGGSWFEKAGSEVRCPTRW